jgi:hypothetical protein
VEQAREPVTPRVVRDEQTEDETNTIKLISAVSSNRLTQLNGRWFKKMMKQAMTTPMNMDKTVVKMVPK